MKFMFSVEELQYFSKTDEFQNFTDMPEKCWVQQKILMLAKIYIYIYIYTYVVYYRYVIYIYIYVYI